MPPTNLAPPLPLDQLHFARQHGVPVAMVGEDGDRIVAFTTDARRALAAALAHYRAETGERGFGLREVQNVCHVQIFDRRGRPPHEPDPDADHDDGKCLHYGLPPCHPETWTFVWSPADPDADNAYPMIKIEIS